MLSHQIPGRRLFLEVWLSYGSPVSPMMAGILGTNGCCDCPVGVQAIKKLLKRYVDDIMEVINKQAVECLTQHLN